MEVIGRTHAKEILQKKMKTPKSELLVVLGRRRVGKTFLIREYMSDDIVFHMTGIYKGRLSEHMERFSKVLSESMGLNSQLTPPKSWFEAFDQLRSYLDGNKSKKKKVVFLDELPWMATNRSRFLPAFTDFWNTYVDGRSDILLIVCGSAASWMINKILRNKGGLHNRVTGRIFLEPFTLRETKIFLKKKNIQASNMDIVRLYMAIGGIPFYLDQMEKGESVVQAIDRICFEKDAILRHEYDELLASLFDNSEKHTAVIEALNDFPKGIKRDEIIKLTGLSSGGGTTSILSELERSGFITSTVPYGKKAKDKLYRLKDYYMLFYLKYIKNTKPSNNRVWEKLSTTRSYDSWAGLAFENVCIDHIDEIKSALRIDGIISYEGAWHSTGNDEMKGAQIDLLIDRADGVINLCEIKFVNSQYTITAKYADELRHKSASFRHFTKTRKALFITMITMHGLTQNKYSNELVQSSMKVDMFF